MLKEIFSADNPKIKLLRALNTRVGRKKNSMFFVEGKRIVEDAILTIPEKIAFIILSKSYYESGIDRNYITKFEINIVPDALFKELSDTKTPQGILAVISHKEALISDFSSNDEHILILDKLQDPGNMGTILRTAEAMGFNNIFLTKDCTDVYSPKGTRSTMGSVFRLNIFENIETKDLLCLKNMGYSLTATALSNNSISLKDAERKNKTAIIIGNEANGVSSDIMEISDFIIKIPMKGKVESLNAAVAAALLMYHFS